MEEQARDSSCRVREIRGSQGWLLPVEPAWAGSRGVVNASQPRLRINNNIITRA